MGCRVMTFGKYKNEPVASIVRFDPDYALWAHRTVPFFELTYEEACKAYDQKEKDKKNRYRPKPWGESWEKDFDIGLWDFGDN